MVEGFSNIFIPSSFSIMSLLTFESIYPANNHVLLFFFNLLSILTVFITSLLPLRTIQLWLDCLGFVINFYLFYHILVLLDVSFSSCPKFHFSSTSFFFFWTFFSLWWSLSPMSLEHLYCVQLWIYSPVEVIIYAFNFQHAPVTMLDQSRLCCISV